MNRVFSRPRVKHIPGSMNGLERDYSQYLDLLKKIGDVKDYKFEGLKLKLAPKTFYTPDFLVVTKDCIELHEVKGFWEDDARVKIKVAADAFWWFRFVAVTRPKKNGGFVYEYFNEAK